MAPAKEAIEKPWAEKRQNDRHPAERAHSRVRAETSDGATRRNHPPMAEPATLLRLETGALRRTFGGRREERSTRRFTQQMVSAGNQPRTALRLDRLVRIRRHPFPESREREVQHRLQRPRTHRRIGGTSRALVVA